MTVTAYVSNPSAVLIVEQASVDFGDGSMQATKGSCATPPTIEHVYAVAGHFRPKVTAATLCGPAGRVDLSNASSTELVFPTRSPASARWPTCSTFQLRITGYNLGAGMGTVGDRVSLQNISTAGCQLEGFAGLQLVASNGRLLPTTVEASADGGMTFPASVPHPVALGPDASASFDLDYNDNPSGAANNEPYAVACPSSAFLRVTLPGTHEYGTAALPMAVCRGVLYVSPLVPGATGLTF